MRVLIVEDEAVIARRLERLVGALGVRDAEPVTRTLMPDDVPETRQG